MVKHKSHQQSIALIRVHIYIFANILISLIIILYNILIWHFITWQTWHRPFLQFHVDKQGFSDLLDELNEHLNNNGILKIMVLIFWSPNNINKG